MYIDQEEQGINIFYQSQNYDLSVLRCSGAEPSSDGCFRGEYNSLANQPLLGEDARRAGEGISRRAKILPLQVGQFQLSVRKQATSPLQWGGRSCACFASYKCGEGAHPVRETYNHLALDSVSIQYGQTDINRFRVERGMSGVKTLSVVSRRHLSVGEIEDNLTTPFIPLPKGDNQELGGVAC